MVFWVEGGTRVIVSLDTGILVEGKWWVHYREYDVKLKELFKWSTQTFLLIPPDQLLHTKKVCELKCINWWISFYNFHHHDPQYFKALGSGFHPQEWIQGKYWHSESRIALPSPTGLFKSFSGGSPWLPYSCSSGYSVELCSAVMPCSTVPLQEK